MKNQNTNKNLDNFLAKKNISVMEQMCLTFRNLIYTKQLYPRLYRRYKI